MSSNVHKIVLRTIVMPGSGVERIDHTTVQTRGVGSHAWQRHAVRCCKPIELLTGLHIKILEKFNQGLAQGQGCSGSKSGGAVRKKAENGS